MRDETMRDRLPFWWWILRILGWDVSQEFRVIKLDHQKCPRVWLDGMPTYEDARRAMQDFQNDEGTYWVQRVVFVGYDYKNQTIRKEGK